MRLRLPRESDSGLPGRSFHGDGPQHQNTGAEIKKMEVEKSSSRSTELAGLLVRPRNYSSVD